MVRRLAFAAFLFALPLFAQPVTSPLSRGLADALYAKLAGGSTIAGTTTLTNLTVTGTCTGCGISGVAWGAITGTLSNQTDLQSALNLKAPLNSPSFTTPSLGVATATSVNGITIDATVPHSSNNLSFFSATSSAQLAALLSDETGTGLAVFATSPTLITPVLGAAAATTINGNTFTTGTYTLTGAAAKTLTFSNSLTLAGADSTTMTFPSTSATIARTDAANTFTGHQTIEGVTSTGATGTGKFVFDGSPAIVTPTIASFANATHNHQNAAGGGTLVDAAITFTAPALGAPTATTIQTSGNVGIGVAPSATAGLRLLAEQDGNQITMIKAFNATAGTGAAASVNVASDVSNVQLTAFSSTFSGTLAGLNLAGSSSVNNAGAGTVGFTIGSTSAAPVVLMSAATRALTISASSQAVSLRGTQTNDNATAGDSGEYQTGTVAANTTSLSTGTTANVGTATNITLAAGDWDCSGVVNFTFGATTSITNLTGGISTTTGTLPAQDSYFDFETSAIIPTGTAVATWVVPTVRLSNSGSTNVFLVSQATFSASTLKVGGTIRCRRMR